MNLNLLPSSSCSSGQKWSFHPIGKISIIKNVDYNVDDNVDCNTDYDVDDNDDDNTEWWLQCWFGILITMLMTMMATNGWWSLATQFIRIDHSSVQASLDWWWEIDDDDDNSLDENSKDGFNMYDNCDNS